MWLTLVVGWLVTGQGIDRRVDKECECIDGDGDRGGGEGVVMRGMAEW